MGGSLGQQLMGGSSSQSNSAQVSDSISEQLARQALFFPSPEALYDTSRLLRGGQYQSEQMLQPYTSIGADALEEIRLLTGLAPTDPLQQQLGELKAAMSSYNAPSGAVVDPVTGVPLFEQVDYRGTPGSLIGSNVPLINAYIAGRGNPNLSSAEQLQQSIIGARNAGIASGFTPGASVTSGPVSVSGRNFQPAIIGAADYPQTFSRTNLSNILPRYSFSGATNTNYINDPLQAISGTLNDIINSDDPEQRQKLYDTLEANMSDFDTRLNQIVAGNITGELPNGPSLREVQASMNQIFSDIKSSFNAEAPKPLTSEQIEEKLTQDPGYQFRFGQGTDAIMKGASATGLLGSGRLLKELDRFGQDLAAQQYQQTLANLTGLAGMGMQGTQTGVGVQQATTPQVTSALQDMSRVWTMSPWTSMGLSRSHSEGASESTSSSSKGGLGSLLGFAAGSR